MCNSSSIVYQSLTEHLRLLLHTFVVDTLLNFPLPFNIPVILSYTNTSRVNVFGRLLVSLYEVNQVVIVPRGREHRKCRAFLGSNGLVRYTLVRPYYTLWGETSYFRRPCRIDSILLVYLPV